MIVCKLDKCRRGAESAGKTTRRQERVLLPLAPLRCLLNLAELGLTRGGAGEVWGGAGEVWGGAGEVWGGAVQACGRSTRL